MDLMDKDMFRALHASSLPSDHVFTVTVGASSKMTLASWHLLEPSDVIATIASLNGDADAGAQQATGATKREVERASL